MNYLEQLLSDLGGPEFARLSAHPESADHVISLEGNACITLSMTADDQHLVLSSAVGVMAPPYPTEGSDSTWSPAIGGIDPPRESDRLVIDHTSGLVVLQRSLPRAALDPAKFRESLEGFHGLRQRWSDTMAPA